MTAFNFKTNVARTIPNSAPACCPSLPVRLNTCSTRANGVAIAPLRRFCVGNACGRMAAPLNVRAPTGMLQPCFAFNVGVAAVGIDIPTGVTQVK